VPAERSSSYYAAEGEEARAVYGRRRRRNARGVRLPEKKRLVPVPEKKRSVPEKKRGVQSLGVGAEEEAVAGALLGSVAVAVGALLGCGGGGDARALDDGARPGTRARRRRGGAARGGGRIRATGLRRNKTVRINTCGDL